MNVKVKGFTMEENSSEELLKKSVEHISYEISMFRACIDFLKKFGLKEASTYEEYVNWQLYVEGLAMHTRILHDFFYYKDREKDAILAKDFIGDERWMLFQQKRTTKEKFTKIIDKCNKQLAHLTEARVTQYSLPQNKGLDPRGVSSMMEITIQTFWEALGDDEKEWFQNYPIVSFENKLN